MPDRAIRLQPVARAEVTIVVDNFVDVLMAGADGVGRYLATDGLGNLLRAVWTSRFGDKKVIFSIPPRYTKQDVYFLKGLVESGEFKPVVDRSYPLDDVVEASRYVETEQKVGNVILTL